MRDKRVQIIIMLTICLVITVAGYYKYENRSLEVIMHPIDEKEWLSFSVEESFQEDAVTVELLPHEKMPKGAKIYYTLDGNQPTVESTEYTEPITVTRDAGFTNAEVIRAVISYKEEYSQVYTKTYFVNEDIAKRYDVLVVSITSDEDNLYDYENGIMVPGKTYDDFMSTKDAEETPIYERPANYNQRGREYERDAYVEIYDSDGTTLIAQACGLRVSGKATASFPQKSLTVCARKQYDEENSKFHFDFFEETEPTEESRVTACDRLTFRSSGNDWYATMIRWNIASEMAIQSGLTGVAEARPAVVYLNGEYYGLTQMQRGYTRDYLARAHHIEKKNAEAYVETLENAEQEIFKQAGITELLYQDLTKLENREALEQFMDVDAFLKYYAFETYISNTDW